MGNFAENLNIGNRVRPPCLNVYYDASMVTRPFSSVIGMSYIGGFKNRFLFLGPTLAQKFLVASN